MILRTRSLVSCLILLVALGMAQAVTAQTIPSPPEIIYTKLINATLESKPSRQAVAIAIGQYCSAISARVPRLSPRERDWLSSELNSNRTLTAMGTPEFARSALGQSLDSCIEITDFLKTAIPIKSEMGLWARVAANLSDGDVGIYAQRLRSAGIMNLTATELDAIQSSTTLTAPLLTTLVVPFLEKK